MVAKYCHFRRWRRSIIVLLGLVTIIFICFHWPDTFQIQKGYSKMSTAIRELASNFHTVEDSTKITLVMAFFHQGSYQREDGSFRKRGTYLRWATMYKHIENPLVFYTDDTRFFRYMTSLRKGKENRTKIFKIDKNSTWAFQREPRVREILSQPGYPRLHPHTGSSWYPCVQFAKYDVIVRATKANYFKTKYIAWIDVGYFRERESKQAFELVKLDSHNESCVAMSQVYNVSLDVTPKEVFLDRMRLVSGAFVFGTRERIIRFAAQFKRAVDYYLSKNLTNTDEQVIYAMFTKQGRKEINPEVEIQYNQTFGWFELGTKMIHELR